MSLVAILSVGVGSSISVACVLCIIVMDVVFIIAIAFIPWISIAQLESCAPVSVQVARDPRALFHMCVVNVLAVGVMVHMCSFDGSFSVVIVLLSRSPFDNTRITGPDVGKSTRGCSSCRKGRWGLPSGSVVMVGVVYHMCMSSNIRICIRFHTVGV